MTLNLKHDPLKFSTLEKHANAAQMLSQLILSDQSSDNTIQLMTPEELEMTLHDSFIAIDKKDPLGYFQIIQKISNSIDLLNPTTTQLININFLKLLVDAINIFKENEKCIYITFLCISKLALIENFRDFFFAMNIFQISLDALSSEDQNISLNALKVISVMIEFAIKKGIQFDVNDLVEILDINQQKRREHEYFVISILHSIVEFADFPMIYEKIFNIISYIPPDETLAESLSTIGDIIYLIIKKDFNYFYIIHFRFAITGPLLEQLDENTVVTQDIFFAIPILQIILCVIDNLKQTKLVFAIQFAQMISYEKYQELIRESIVEVSELALQIVSFLLSFNPDRWLNLCFENKLVQIVMKKFIDEAPFYKKYPGINFLLAVSKTIKTIKDLNLLLSLNIIEECSFCMDGDDYKSLNQYLKIILNLLCLSIKLNDNDLISIISENILKFDVIERSYQFVDNFSMDEEFPNHHKLQKIILLTNQITQRIQNLKDKETKED